MPGITIAMTKQEPIDFFNLFITTDVKNLIFNETTRYAEQILAATETFLEEHKYARGNAWRKHPMTREETEPLLAIIILMGLVGFPTVR